MNSESYFFSNIMNGLENQPVFKDLETWSKTEKKNVYVLNAPLGNEEYSYEYEKAFIVLIPSHKILFIDFGGEENAFEDYYDDVIEDVSFISDKYDCKKLLGRKKKWEPALCKKISVSEYVDIPTLLNVATLNDYSEKRSADVLISLFTGSINDIEQIGLDVPTSDLDKIKQKIILFDGDQTRFIYEKTTNGNLVRIQGLSGTGKTELLLHKIKNLYLKNDTDKILLTCHNKILAHDLNERIPRFFDFMKVDKQISQNRLICMHSWGSAHEMGTYRYLCGFYGLPFFSLRWGKSFDDVCAFAAKQLSERKKRDQDWKYAFDWTFVDECQDFGDGFIQLCQIVTKNQVYVAGDIFQSIFDDFSNSRVKPDYLLSKCYRTDPKTLMFAHGLGMGLFETRPLKWLEDEQWESCGYSVTRNQEKTIILKREPLRRFEDLTDDYKSIDLIVNETSGFSALEKIVQKIQEIAIKNPSVKPDDICVILLDDCKEIYNDAVFLQQLIEQNFGWRCNRAYETKMKIDGCLQISNRNNVKGLEFPFVICHTRQIERNLRYRNALYTMMTRSFLQTTLIVDRMDAAMLMALNTHLNEIQTQGQMSVIEPNDDEKRQILMNIDAQTKKKSLNEIFDSVCKEHKIPQKYRAKLYRAINGLIEEDSFEEDKVSEAILVNYDMMKGKN